MDTAGEIETIYGRTALCYYNKEQLLNCLKHGGVNPNKLNSDAPPLS